MKVTLKYFSIYEEILGKKEETTEVGGQMTVEELFKEILKDHSLCHEYLRSTLFAVNQKYVPRDFKLKGGDEVAFIPPVAGG